MSDKHEAHLKQLIEQFSQLMAAKYRKGAAEHGGFLPEHPDLLDEAVAEAIDLVVYLLTLKNQRAADTRPDGVERG